MTKYTVYLEKFESLPREDLTLEALYAILCALNSPDCLGDYTRNEALCAALFFRATGLSSEPEEERASMSERGGVACCPGWR